MNSKEKEVPDWLDQFGREAVGYCETLTPSIRWSAGYGDDYECWCMELWPALMFAPGDEGEEEIQTFEHFQRIDITGILSTMDEGSRVELSDVTQSDEGPYLLFEGKFDTNRVMLRIFREPRDDEPIFRLRENGTMESLSDESEFAL